MFQTIINLMPPHHTYVELFLGSGQVYQRKKRATVNIGVEIDPAVTAQWPSIKESGLSIHQMDAIRYLATADIVNDPETLIYADPPYLLDARTSASKIYRHEFCTPIEHMDFLARAREVPAMMIISGYRHPIYDKALETWRRVDYKVTTRGTSRIECAWLNFDPPDELHDYSYFGATYRDRQDLKRLKLRWSMKFRKMPPQQRFMIAQALNEFLETK